MGRHSSSGGQGEGGGWAHKAPGIVTVNESIINNAKRTSFLRTLNSKVKRMWDS